MRQELLDALRPVTKEEQRILDGQKGIDRELYMEGNGNVINSRKLLEAGRIISVRKHTRFVHFPEHTHDYVEVMYMVEGETTHVVDGDTIHLKAGELLFMSQNATQEIQPAGEGDIGVNFIILPEFFDSTLAMMDGEDSPLRRFLIDCLRGENSAAGYLHFQVADVIPVQNLVENLIWSLIYEPHGRRKINQGTMAILIMHLMNHTDTLHYRSPEQQMQMEILSYIEDNYREGSLEELSQLLHYDMSTLSREIKKRFGKNYTDLVQDKRLVQAVFMLKHTNLSVADIGFEIGYDNISYFYRIFQKKYGMTPKQYRKQLAEVDSAAAELPG